jgi:type I restriction enzyme R subunit
LCEPVEPPKGELEHIHYFCGNTEIKTDLEERKPQRAALYKAIVAVVRAYAHVADELDHGYDAAGVTRIKDRLKHYLSLREIVRKASGESLDLKPYEADMRHLIDTYIEADEPRKISPFDNMGLLELIVTTGIANTISSQLGELKGKKDAIAETIENNVRRKIIKEHLSDPAYYEKMSALLDEIIAARKAKAIEYEEYLSASRTLARRVEAGWRTIRLNSEAQPGAAGGLQQPSNRSRPNVAAAQAVAYDSGADEKLVLAMRIDETVKRVRPDGWRGVSHASR